MQFALQNYILLAIPLFILAAKLMNTAGISMRIFRFADTLVGFLPGGLGHANILGSLIFSGMSGAAVVDAAGIGQIEHEAMTKSGYPSRFAVACTAASSIIGPIFPPSIPMVVFSFVSGVSVGRLFLGGVVPGLLMTAALMVWVAIQSKKHSYPRQPFPTLEAARRSFAEAVVPLMAPVILLGGIWTGIFTPTEAAGVASLYALVVGVFVLRELSFRDLVEAFTATARETAVIGFLVAGSAFYGWVLMRTGLTLKLAETLVDISRDPTVILILINLFLLVVGCFLDSTVAILILGPIFMPVLAKAGIDPVHFGVVMVLNLMIGLMTPPFGMILFVMQQVSGLSFEEVVKACMPTLVPLVVVLVLITFVPSIVTWLPKLFL
jgi:tripartite ATP-independent transporter DctM subunit